MYNLILATLTVIINLFVRKREFQSCLGVCVIFPALSHFAVGALPCLEADTQLWRDDNAPFVAFNKMCRKASWSQSINVTCENKGTLIGINLSWLPFYPLVILHTLGQNRQENSPYISFFNMSMFNFHDTIRPVCSIF